MKRTTIILSALAVLLLGLVPAAAAQQGDNPSPPGNSENSCGRGNAQGRPYQQNDPPGLQGREDPATSPGRTGNQCPQVRMNTENAKISVFPGPNRSIRGGDIVVEDQDGGAQQDGGAGAQQAALSAVAQDDGSYTVTVPLSAAEEDGTIALAITSSAPDGSTETERIVVDTTQPGGAVAPAPDAPARSVELGVAPAAPQAAPANFVSALQERPADGYGLIAVVVLLGASIAGALLLRRRLHN